MTALENVNGHFRDQIAIVSRRLEHGIVLVVSGEIDLATAPAVERELRHAEEYHDLIAIDLSKVSFMDSTGLHTIMDSNRRLRARGGRLLIVEGPPQIIRLFELTGVRGHLDVVGNETDLAFAANGNRALLSAPAV